MLDRFLLGTEGIQKVYLALPGHNQLYSISYANLAPLARCSPSFAFFLLGFNFPFISKQRVSRSSVQQLYVDDRRSTSHTFVPVPFCFPTHECSFSYTHGSCSPLQCFRMTRFRGSHEHVCHSFRFFLFSLGRIATALHLQDHDVSFQHFLFVVATFVLVLPLALFHLRLSFVMDPAFLQVSVGDGCDVPSRTCLFPLARTLVSSSFLRESRRHVASRWNRTQLRHQRRQVAHRRRDLRPVRRT
mmetsp:Transcript_2127/g.13895  ORF Transcript_2127/g.13895 Transcript_2127/m.13895 type:complete len:244 (+) Transcript_2127:2916-3647(+)